MHVTALTTICLSKPKDQDSTSVDPKHVTRRRTQLVAAHTVALCAWQKAHHQSSHMCTYRACSYSLSNAFPGDAFARAQLACKKASTLFRLLAPAPIRTFSYMKLRLFQLPLPLSGPNMGCVHKMSICTKISLFESRLTEQLYKEQQKVYAFRMRSLHENALCTQYAHAAAVCSKTCMQTVPSLIPW